MVNRRGVVQCGLAAVLFGVSAPAASRLAGDMGGSPWPACCTSALRSPCCRSPVVGRPVGWPCGPSLPNLALAVVLGGAVGPVLLAFGLGRVPAATSSLLLNLELVFTTLVAGLVFREHIGRAVAAGTALVLAGGVLLGWSGSPDARWGAVLIAGACLCWAIDNSATAAIDQIAPAHVTLVKGVVAGGTNLAIGLAVGGPPPLGPTLGALAIGALGYGVSITLWVAGARELGAARGQLVFATAPFVGAVVAWAVLGERVSGRAVAAFVLGALGVGSVLFSAHAHDHAHRPLAHTHEHGHDDGHHDGQDGHHDGHDEPDGDRHRPSRHDEPHEHAALAHRHPHLPDLHHRHGHGDAVH